MFLIPLLTIIFVVWLIMYLINPGHHNSYRGYDNNASYRTDKPLEILKERYAKGEIDEEEYLRIKRNLEK